MSASATSEHELKVAADFQQLVDDIESLMASPAGVEPDAVVRLHAKYLLAIRAINTRLRDCDELLKKGLRNEAIGRSEIAPNLLELFIILDFPERDSWEDTVRQCGLSVPDLFVAVAAELNDAYATEKPLADLKYQVRLHALARSSLSIRIKLMRRLAKQDQNSSVWDEDLITFERTRHNQLTCEVTDAVKSGSMSVLSELCHELQSPDWTVPPPGGLLKQAADALLDLQRRHAREHLSELEPKLNAAFSAFDVDRGRELRHSWQKMTAVAALPEFDPLMQRAASALQWLQNQDQLEHEELVHQSAISGLALALDQGASRSVLQERYRAIVAMERGIPDDLKERLEQRVRQLDREKARSLQLKLAGAGLTVCLVAGLVVFLILNARFRSQLVAQVTAVDKLLDDKAFQSAEDQLAKLETSSPRMAATPEIQQIKAKLKDAQEIDAARKVKLSELLTTAKHDGVEQATYESIPAAIDALSKAWDIALNSEEKSTVKELSNQVAERRTVLQKQVDHEFNDDYANLVQEFGQLKATPRDHLDELESLRAKAAIVMQRAGVAEPLRATKRPLINDIDATINKGRMMQSEAKILLEMNAAVGDRGKYFDRMDQYINSREFAGRERHNDFVRVRSTDAPMVAAFHEWQTFLEDLMRRDLTTLNAATAGKIRIEAEKLIKDYPAFAFVPQLQDMATYLGKAVNRERGSISMDNLLALKTFKVLSVRSDGKQYYIPIEPTKDATGSANIRYFTDTEFKTTKPIRLASIDHDSKWRSPQLIFEIEAAELLGKLRDKKGANWDQTFIELLEKLFNNADMDDILKVQIISHTLRASAEGSSFLTKRLERVKTEIERENLNNAANWVSPDDPEVAQVRIRAQTLLKRLGTDLRDLKGVLADEQQLYETYTHPKFDIRYAWTAWLHRDPDGKWTCTFRGNAPLNQLGDLHVLIKSEAGQIHFEPVGRIQQGQPVVNSDSQILLEGRPVFEKKPDPTGTITR